MTTIEMIVISTVGLCLLWLIGKLLIFRAYQSVAMIVAAVIIIGLYFGLMYVVIFVMEAPTIINKPLGLVGSACTMGIAALLLKEALKNFGTLEEEHARRKARRKVARLFKDRK